MKRRLNMVMRDYLNEGGKVLATGKNHGFEEFFPLNYGENGAPTETCTSGNCLVMTDDVYQYWFGAFSRSRRGGLAPDGTAYDVSGTSGAFDGYSFGLDGGDSADNQGAPGAASTGTAFFGHVVGTDQLHPWLFRYQTLNGDGTCSPTGTTGEWHAATGPSTGIEQWSIDLSAYAGFQVEVSITFATDWGTGDLGVFVDDASVNIDGTEVLATSFEDGLGDFNLPGSPEGSAPNPGDWERVGLLFEIASIVATDDTLLFGFGFEGISTDAERNEVMARSLDHFGIG